VPVDVARLLATWPRATPEATEREFRRRIAATAPATPYPGVADHYRGLVSFLLDAGKPRLAADACLEMRAAGLAPGWTERALATARLASGDRQEAEAELRRWADRQSSLVGYTCLAAFQRAAGDDDAAREALALAAEQDDFGQADGFVPDAWYYEAATSAYALGEFDVARALCDRWERECTARGSGERSYRLIRAACHVAAGAFDVARADGRAAGDHALWAGRPEDVLAAAAARDRGWRARFPEGRAASAGQYTYE
jgi:hypothetical protein